jgi:hypothetical protein
MAVKLLASAPGVIYSPETILLLLVLISLRGSVGIKEVLSKLNESH